MKIPAAAIAILVPAIPILLYSQGCDVHRGDGESSQPELAVSYFPPGSLSDRPDLHAFRVAWYSKHLTALQEPSLFALRSDAEAEVYRFLWLRTFDHPIAVRIICKKRGSTIVIRMCDGAGGYSPGKLILNRSAPFSRQKKTQLAALLETSGFWGLPSMDPSFSGLDGSKWIIEAVKDGRYHIVDRWSPDSGPIRDLGLFLLKAANLDDEKLY